MWSDVLTKMVLVEGQRRGEEVRGVDRCAQ